MAGELWHAHVQQIKFSEQLKLRIITPPFYHTLVIKNKSINLHRRFNRIHEKICVHWDMTQLAQFFAENKWSIWMGIKVRTVPYKYLHRHIGPIAGGQCAANSLGSAQKLLGVLSAKCPVFTGLLLTAYAKLFLYDPLQGSIPPS